MEQHGVRVLVDSKAVMHVVGTRMDFVSDRLRRAPSARRSPPRPARACERLRPRPRRSEFVFENPNSKGSCGCGESFTT